MQGPAPQAVFKAFGDGSINFELRAWTNRFERWPKIETELAGAIYAALHAAGMSLPFPSVRCACCATSTVAGVPSNRTRDDAMERRSPPALRGVLERRSSCLG
jgi:small-conductance mechanosensitive channel